MIIKETEKFPTKLFSLSLVVTIAVLFWFTLNIFQIHKQSQFLFEKTYKAMKLRGEILQYDEILTMSARLAASSGNTAWEARYRKYEILLDKAIKEAGDIVPSTSNHEIAAKTDIANQKLVAMENQSFNFVKKGRIKEAQEILFGEEYEKQKKIYAAGMRELEDRIEREAINLQHKGNRKKNFAIMLSLFMTIILIVFWIRVFVVFRESNNRLLKTQNDLVEAQKSLEQRVEQRTADLLNAYESLERESHQRERMQSELLQSEKFASVGQLAGGIAHEINTPIQYIGDNLRFIYREQAKIIEALSECSAATKEEIDLDFLKEEIPSSVEQSIQGVEHVVKLVRSMKEFAHPGSSEFTQTDINRAIENAVNVSKNEWKYVAELECKLDGNLPKVPCLYSEFNQVLLNIIVNAAQAIEEKNSEAGGKGIISISTKRLKETIEIRVSDTGTGISEAIQGKIFDPFFTTKGVGKGTGQGLAIAYKLITEKLKGAIKVESEVGKGTTFVITLPILSQADISNE
ncbi:MAG: hypothetical protein KZQ99_12215 [Candidatus Thiodiazotropha sp. (ex Dulcina madagascariensis)]|nr:hypothetical protein [Candidatus Thiodiazotropha sp. (ex Dulcina madagascariensis)]